MSEIRHLVDQLDRAHNGNAWHGLALRELLEDVTPEEAATLPPRATHSIWQLVHHITAWIEVPTSRLAGVAVNVTSEVNWKPVPAATERTWNDAREGLERAYERFRARVVAVDPDGLDEPWGDGGSLRIDLIHGVIQHMAYHGGQIALVKKMLRAKN